MNDNSTLLIRACERANTNAIKYLLEQGVNPNAQDHRGNTAAMHLIGTLRAESTDSCLELLKELVIHNADFSLVDNNKCDVLWRIMSILSRYDDSWNECQKFIINILKHSNNDALLTQVKKLSPGPRKKAVMEAAGFDEPTMLVIMVEDLMFYKAYYRRAEEDLLLRVDQKTIQSLPDKIFKIKLYEPSQGILPIYFTYKTTLLLSELPGYHEYKLWSSHDIELIKLLVIANADIPQYENFVNDLHDISKEDAKTSSRTNAVILTETKKEILDLIKASKCLENHKAIGVEEQQIAPLIKQLAWDRLCFLIQSNNVQHHEMKVEQLQQLAKYIKDNYYQGNNNYKELLTYIIQTGFEEYIPIIASSMKDPKLAYNVECYIGNFLENLDIVTLEVEKILDSDSVNDSILPRGLALRNLPTQKTDLNNIYISPEYKETYESLKQLKWFQNIISKLDSTLRDNQDNANTVKYYQEHPEAFIPARIKAKIYTRQ